MSKLWLPPDVSDELRANTAAHNAAVLDMLEFDDRSLDHVRRELELFDPLLRLGKAKAGARLPGVRPGFWHVVRLNECGPYFVQPLTDENDGWAEPALSMFDMLRQADLQNPEVVAARRRVDVLAEREAEGEKQRFSDDMAAEVEERWAAATETRVSMSQDSAWTQNVSGKRGRRV